MDANLIEKIKTNPKYQELIKKRGFFSIMLTILIFVLYYGFILLVAFNKEFLATKVSSESILSIAFPIVSTIIIISIIISAIYVIRANGEFEDLTNEIKNDVKDLV